jgi:Uri superfamily endonuclease
MADDLYRVDVIGDDSQGGTYVLRIRVSEDLAMPFGRFREAKVIDVPRGDVLYIGSALATKGGVSLARRLVRHASRTGALPPHAMRDVLVARFAEVDLGSGDLRPRNGKKLHWNVDHLLDRPEADLTRVYAIRSEQRLERVIGEMLLADPHTHILAKGLGANDLPGNTNILRVDADDTWWDTLPVRLYRLIAI